MRAALYQPSLTVPDGDDDPPLRLFDVMFATDAADSSYQPLEF